ncbi:putative carboxypeptidase [Actinoplanes missouriensis 431]|uniref:Putative carboxypeptidase n=1 Tax=Actinoplanes missouriensis (strain ATCC 14538 / DSM 43046 / CBS 188.64 / JCM 3121 / NBRC 102363 / NCIMB 12654 / NRRL B-3342 / UNCC 431) TaxID=512565 RepID=I0HDG4_ACTM4|nr:M14 family zinc carboxypeptidase [Actinoplanes missouriensis]BAL91051.1 putative carboxypeptidase [Actinoplanes missouriensis 431]
MRWPATLTAALLTATLLTVQPATAQAAEEPTITLNSGERALIRFQLTDEAAFERLLRSGADIAARPRTTPGAVLADLVVDDRELAELRKTATPVQLIQKEGATRANRSTARIAAADTLSFLQAYWWTSNGRTFLQTQVATTASDDPDVEITVTWTTADGQTGSYPLVRFEDADEYQYHYALPQPLPAKPVKVTATSSLGGQSRAVTPSAWPGATPPANPAGYQKDFIDAYMTPTDITARIKRLSRQYPKLVDVINLPNKTQGYRRTAVTYLGDPATAAIVVESVKFGDQGYNGVQVRTVDPGRRNSPLRAEYRDRVLTIRLATGAAGEVISTTDQVAAFIAAKYPQRFSAFVEEGSAGLIMPVAGPARLDDGLAGTEVSHKPQTVQALRIGKVRDGSKPGVLAYSQEHAREWATPLVTLEFAERLLANYATDPATRSLVDSTDVFIIPTVNPDGANYSFNDFNFQRKNLVNHCTGAQRDPRYRNSWGVDVNRNYAVGSYFDGYVGASANCLSGTYAGTSELSEAESRNVVALASKHSNIKFSMNVHSYGGYFMWSPGAYKVPGRITLPRPSIDESKFFLDSARRIVGAIATERGTVTWPAYTGPVADVLYSAAGNSADHLYYDLGITAWNFEVGNDRWNEATQQWEGVGFQPPFDEAHSEAQEYAGGLIELVRIARDQSETR